MKNLESLKRVRTRSGLREKQRRLSGSFCQKTKRNKKENIKVARMTHNRARSVAAIRKIARKDQTAALSKKNKLETRKALRSLQKLRDGGTWAMCSIKSCSKWRYLPQVKDPIEVAELFTCQDCPDPKYGHCGAEEQEWDSDVDCHYETKYTVGSLVWAKINGSPAWPAMVDDDPNTGTFFRTEKDGQQAWEPSSYHVIFFDEKTVSRAWLASSRLTKFQCILPKTARSAQGSRLLAAFNTAVEAAGKSLEVRRKRYCFTQVFQGNWGTVWRNNDTASRRNCKAKTTKTKSKTEKQSCGPIGEESQPVSDISKSPVLITVKPVLAKKSKPVNDGDTSLHGLNTARKSKKTSQVTSKLVMSGIQDSPVPISQYEEDSLAMLVREALNNSWMFTPTQ